MTNRPKTCLESSWQIATGPVPLPPDEVHVWRAELDVDPVALRRLRETLSADEQARAERFHAPADRSRYIAGRGILRALLASYLGARAGDLRFHSNAHGKPALLPGSGTEDLRFNLAHSHGRALFAFAVGREVGVDLEYVEPARADHHLAERFFSPQEVTMLRTLPESVQTDAFFHCWTRKEAYLKARGEGLGCGLARFTVSVTPSQQTDLLLESNDSAEAGRWSLRALAPGDGYVGAVAAEGKDWSLALWQWT